GPVSDARQPAEPGSPGDQQRPALPARAGRPVLLRPAEEEVTLTPVSKPPVQAFIGSNSWTPRFSICAARVQARTRTFAFGSPAAPGAPAPPSPLPPVKDRLPVRRK